MEDENQTGKNTSGTLGSLRHIREKNRYNKLSDFRRGPNKLTMDRKYLERYKE